MVADCGRVRAACEIPGRDSGLSRAEIPEFAGRGAQRGSEAAGRGARGPRQVPRATADVPRFVGMLVGARTAPG